MIVVEHARHPLRVLLSKPAAVWRALLPQLRLDEPVWDTTRPVQQLRAFGSSLSDSLLLGARNKVSLLHAIIDATRYNRSSEHDGVEQLLTDCVRAHGYNFACVPAEDCALCEAADGVLDAAAAAAAEETGVDSVLLLCFNEHSPLPLLREALLAQPSCTVRVLEASAPSMCSYSGLPANVMGAALVGSQLDVVRALLQYGVSPRVTSDSDDGWTPAMLMQLDSALLVDWLALALVAEHAPDAAALRQVRVLGGLKALQRYDRQPSDAAAFRRTPVHSVKLRSGTLLSFQVLHKLLEWQEHAAPLQDTLLDYVMPLVASEALPAAAAAACAACAGSSTVRVCCEPRRSVSVRRALRVTGVARAPRLGAVRFPRATEWRFAARQGVRLAPVAQCAALRRAAHARRQLSG